MYVEARPARVSTYDLLPDTLGLVVESSSGGKRGNRELLRHNALRCRRWTLVKDLGGIVDVVTE